MGLEEGCVLRRFPSCFGNAAPGRLAGSLLPPRLHCLANPDSQPGLYYYCSVSYLNAMSSFVLPHSSWMYRHIAGCSVTDLAL